MGKLQKKMLMDGLSKNKEHLKETQKEA